MNVRETMIEQACAYLGLQGISVEADHCTAQQTPLPGSAWLVQAHSADVTYHLLVRRRSKTVYQVSEHSPFGYTLYSVYKTGERPLESVPYEEQAQMRAEQLGKIPRYARCLRIDVRPNTQPPPPVRAQARGERKESRILLPPGRQSRRPTRAELEERERELEPLKRQRYRRDPPREPGRRFAWLFLEAGAPFGLPGYRLSYKTTAPQHGTVTLSCCRFGGGQLALQHEAGSLPAEDGMTATLEVVTLPSPNQRLPGTQALKHREVLCFRISQGRVEVVKADEGLVCRIGYPAALYQLLVRTAVEKGATPPHPYETERFLASRARADASLPFGWILSKYSSTLIDPEQSDGLLACLSYTRRFRGTRSDRRDCFWFDGLTLAEAAPEQLEAQVLAGFGRSFGCVLASWESAIFLPGDPLDHLAFLRSTRWGRQKNYLWFDGRDLSEVSWQELDLHLSG